MSKVYWLTIKTKKHAKYPLSHSDPLALTIYFDRDASTFGKGEGFREGDYSDDNRHVSAGMAMSHSKDKDAYHFIITEEEYNSENFELFVWMEPYGAAAVAHPEVSEGLLIGRLAFKKSTQKGGLPQPPPSSQPDDEQMVFEVEIGDSVAQYIATEMNLNAKSDLVKSVRKKLDALPLRGDGGLRDEIFKFARQGYSEWQLARATHKNEDKAGLAQDIVFLGGGEWDHKPLIRPVWGAKNRLGNSGYVYYYDAWSNLHFGYIAAALDIPLFRALAGAGLAQTLDSAEGWFDQGKAAAGIVLNPPNWRSDEAMRPYLLADAEADRRAILHGYQLFKNGTPITYGILTNLATRNPAWLHRE